jgi:hypothetical protein
MADVLPEVQGGAGPQEVAPVILVDSTGALYKALTNAELTAALAGSAALAAAATQRATFVDYAPVLDTTQYAASDVLSETTEIANFFRANGVGGMLISLQVVDRDKEANDDMVVYFLDANVSVGSRNAAEGMDDADVDHILAKVAINNTTDWTTMANHKIAQLGALNRILKPAADSRSLFVAIICGSTGTRTYTAATDIRLKIGVVLD